MEDMIIREAMLLNDRLEELVGSETVVRLDHVFSAFAGDAIAKICCDKPPNMMNKPEFGKEWQVIPKNSLAPDSYFSPYRHDLIERIVHQVPLFMHIPQLVQ